MPRLHALSLATALLGVSTSVAQAPIIAVWKLDEATGLTATDSGPLGNVGTLNGYTSSGTWVTGQFRNGLSFDGIDDYVDITQRTGLPIYRGLGAPFSVSFWVKAPPGDDDRVYSEGNNNFGSNGGSLFTIGTGRNSRGNTDKLQIYIRNDNNAAIELYSVSTVFDDTWHHVSYVDNCGDAKLYVDGQLDGGSFDYRQSGIGTQTSTHGVFTMNRVSLGAVLRANVVAHFTGILDEVIVHNYALEPADVQALIADQLPFQCRPSIGEFGVGCGTTPFDLAASGDASAGGAGLTLQLQNGVAGANAFLLFGAGPLAPVDLSGAGFAGCTLYIGNPFSIPLGPLDAQGGTQPVTIPIPNSQGVLCVKFNFQGAALDTTNGSFIFSDTAIVHVGL